ncbi:MAG: hypothetical protein WKF97_25365 [Chitinophagaceae bacterium]
MHTRYFSVYCLITATILLGMMCVSPAFSQLSLTVGEPATASRGTGAINAEDIFKGMKYRNIGPNRGGRSLGVSGSPSRKNEYYFGAVGGGLWKTIDGGLNWLPVTDGQMESSSVGAVAVSESNPDVVYIGTGETQFRGNIMQGDGVYKTTDGGKTWKNVGLKNTQAIARVRVHPTNPDIVYAAVLGHPYGPHADRGIFRTRDGGKTWNKVLYKTDKAGAADVIIDRTNPDVLYASIWEVYRTPWKMWGGGGSSGLFKSTDGGDTWIELTKKPGMPKGLVGKIGVTVSPADPKRVWAIVEADSGGVYRSDDAGMTWKLTNNERKLRQRAFYYSRLYADPKDKDVVYGLNVGFFKSTDGGVKFDKTIRVPHGDNHDLWIDPTDPMRMGTSNDGGGAVSENGGKSWTDENFPTAQLYHITVTNDFPYHVAGAQQDNSTVAVASEGWDFMQARQNTLKRDQWMYAVGGGESGYITQDPKNPDIFYAGSQGALITRTDRKTGQTRDIQPYPRFFSGEPASALPERWQWTFPIVFSPVDPTRLYICSQHVWLTTNEGQTWKKISPDLTLADTATMGKSGGVITGDMNGPEIYATVFTLAPSYHDVNTIWAGSDDGLVHITRNGGGSWEKITPPDMPKFTRISIIEASRHKPGTAFVAGKRYQLDDRAPYIWKTEDYGKTWTKIINGIKEDDYVHVVREDVKRAGLLFAGTEHGLRISFDNGQNWQSLQLNLPNTQVADLAVTVNDLVVGTHGRSIYVLDEIGPLREFQPEIIKAKAFLFKPSTAVRRVQNTMIQYYLPTAVDSLKIDILDSEGKLVRSFKGTKAKSDSANKAPEVLAGNQNLDSVNNSGVIPTGRMRADSAAEDSDAGFFGRAAPKPPTVNEGINQFEWDLRYPGATEFPGMIVWSARPQMGPLAVPGKYEVKLTAAGETLTHPFEITLDPRLKNVTLEDVKEQFKLAMELRDKTSKANESVIQIRSIKETLSKKKEKSAADNRLIAQLSAIEEALYQVRNQSGQDPLNFPIKLNNRLAALWRSVETGDAKPTDASYQITKDLSAELDKQLVELNKLTNSKKAF